MHMEVDFEKLIEQYKNQIALEAFVSLIPEENDKILMKNILEVFSNYGISVEIAIKLIGDLNKILNKEND